MKLALVTGEFPPMQGGVGDYTYEIAKEFARRGIMVTVITDQRSAVGGSSPRRGSPVWRALRAAARSAATRDSARAPQSGGGDMPYATRTTQYAHWRSLPHISKLTRDYHLVHIQYQAAAYGMTPPIHFLPRYLRWRNARRKVLVTFHDLKIPYLFPKAGRLRWRAVTFLAQSCDAVIVTNQEDLQVMSTVLPHHSWLKMIPIGSNIDAQVVAPIERDSLRASLGVQADQILLCYFGFLNASKGGETLVRVLEKVIRAGYNARLLMLGGEVGTSDPTNLAYAQKVKTLLNELNLSERVVWSGYRPADEVTALWRASDIAVLPYADGASLRRGTLIAALAHAMPIVSTTPRLPVPQLRNGENITLAPIDDVEALAKKVMALIESPMLRERLSQAAAQLATQFSWSAIVDQHLELYRTITTG